jgi:hypothetical protein
MPPSLADATAAAAVAAAEAEKRKEARAAWEKEAVHTGRQGRRRPRKQIGVGDLDSAHEKEGEGGSDAGREICARSQEIPHGSDKMKLHALNGFHPRFIVWVRVLLGFHPDETLFHSLLTNTLPTQLKC